MHQHLHHTSPSIHNLGILPSQPQRFAEHRPILLPPSFQTQLLTIPMIRDRDLRDLLGRRSSNVALVDEDGQQGLHVAAGTQTDEGERDVRLVADADGEVGLGEGFFS